jgi:hypothetical protein
MWVQIPFDIMYRQFVCTGSVSAYSLLASAVGLLTLFPFLVVNAESFLSNILETLCVHGNRSIGEALGHRIDVFLAPVLNDLMLFARTDPDMLVVRQGVGQHADNEESGGTQSSDQGVNATIQEVCLLKLYWYISCSNRSEIKIACVSAEA